MLLGVDVGGTFTDAVLVSGERLFTAKAPSTPKDQSEGVMDAVEELRMLFDEKPHANGAPSLFVAGESEDQISGRRLSRRGDVHEGRHEHCCAALHVERPTSPHLTVDKLGAAIDNRILMTGR